MNLLKESIFTLLIFSCLSCMPSSNESSESFFIIPAINIDCKSEQSLDCNSSADNRNKTFYIGLTTETGIQCRDYLLQIPTGQFSTYFDANGSSLTEFSGVLEGTVNQWKNNNGSPTSHLGKADHVACAYIDSNGNERLDFDETVGQGLLNPADDSPLINDWF